MQWHATNATLPHLLFVTLFEVWDRMGRPLSFIPRVVASGMYCLHGWFYAASCAFMQYLSEQPLSCILRSMLMAIQNFLTIFLISALLICNIQCFALLRKGGKNAGLQTSLYAPIPASSRVQSSDLLGTSGTIHGSLREQSPRPSLRIRQDRADSSAFTLYTYT
jgi:hypothetical protein